MKLFLNVFTSDTLEEIEEIEDWLNNETNKKIFIEYVKVNYLIDLNLKKFNTSSSQKKLLEFISKEKRVMFANNMFHKWIKN